MNGELWNFAQQLQKKLESLDPQQDRDTLVWAHGFLTGIISHIQSAIPDLITPRTLLQSSQADLDSILQKRVRCNTSVDPDSLDLLEGELGEPGEASVPAKRKPGPKGLSGGAALPLPDSELPM